MRTSNDVVQACKLAEIHDTVFGDGGNDLIFKEAR